MKHSMKMTTIHRYLIYDKSGPTGNEQRLPFFSFFQSLAGFIHVQRKVSILMTLFTPLKIPLLIDCSFNKNDSFQARRSNSPSFTLLPKNCFFKAEEKIDIFKTWASNYDGQSYPTTGRDEAKRSNLLPSESQQTVASESRTQTGLGGLLNWGEGPGYREDQNCWSSQGKTPERRERTETELWGPPGDPSGEGGSARAFEGTAGTGNELETPILGAHAGSEVEKHSYFMSFTSSPFASVVGKN